MAATKDSGNAHVVEIPAVVQQEEHQKLVISAIQQHPLRQISESSGHLLLLKLWQREEHLFGLRTGRRETKMEFVKQQIFQLCCYFFLFHALSLTSLFTASDRPDACRKWWVPAVSMAATSGVFAMAVQVKVWVYWKAAGELQRERSENRALTRCVQELRMKGSCFNLCKEPQIGSRMKSSSVEIKWGPLTWLSRNLIAISLLGFAGLVFPASKLILCGV